MHFLGGIMKVNVVIGCICAMLLGQVCSNTNSDVQQISQRLQNLSDISRSMQKSFERSDFVSFVDDVALFLADTPIFYEIQTVLFDEPNTIIHFNVAFGKIKDNLDNISTAVDNVKHDAFRRLLSANMHKQQTDIFKSSDKLKDCSRHWSLMLLDDRDFSHTIDVVNCYDKTGDLRQFGTLLANSDLFDEIIKGMGHFDGNVIMSVYQYLLGFYAQSCMTTSAAESLKYKMSQTSTNDQCVASLRSAVSKLDTLNSKCRDESCETLNKNLRQLSGSADFGTVSSSIQSYYPCFRFLMLQFSTATDPNEMLEGDVLNHLEIQYDQRIDMLFWTDRESKQFSSTVKLHQYSIQFSNSSLQNIYNGINLKLESSTVSSGRIRLVGYTEYPVRSNKCKETVIDTKQDNCSGLECTIALEKYLPYVVMPSIAAVVLIIIVVETVIIVCLCRRKQKPKNKN